MDKIVINGQEISLYLPVKESDYICMTDIAKLGDSESTANDRIRNWLRNKNTIEFLGLWEELNNPNSKPVEFDRIKDKSGVNAFTISLKQWIENTNAIGIISKGGSYGGYLV